MTLTVTTAIANAQLNALATNFNSGQLAIFSGAAPANADAALAGNAVLASDGYGATAFGAAAARNMTANALTQLNAYSNGTATFFRSLSQGGSIAATAMVAGSVYMVNAPGTTNFTTYGAPNSSANTVFVATGAGTGTGTVYPMTTIEQGACGQSESGAMATFTPAQMTLTVAPTSGGFATGQALTAAGITAGTTLGTLASGTANTVGAVYNINGNSLTVGAATAVTATSGDLALLSTSIVAGQPVQITSATRSM